MKKYFRYGFLLLAVLLLWDAVILQPLKIFASYIHQLGHFIMGFIFSYNPGNDFIVNITETSYKILSSKSVVSSFFVANGGYIASLLFGFFVIYLKDTHSKKYVPGMFALFFVIIAAKFSGLSNQLMYSAIFAAVAIALHLLHKEKLYEWVLELVGISSFAFALRDLAVNTIYYELNLYFHFNDWSGSIPYSDTLQMQNITHIPSLVWGVLWIAGLGVAYFFFFNEESEGEASPSEASSEAA